MSSPYLSVFKLAQPQPEYDHPRPERLVKGNPLRTTYTHFERAGFSAGEWVCEPGAWRIAFPEDEDEFFHIISGRVRITHSDGTAHEFGPGEACVIPAGFTGTFEVLETVRKHFVVMARSAP